MSLTTDDLQQIRSILRQEVRPIVREEVRPIIREEVDYIVTERLKPLEGKIEALENDIKEIYGMV